MTHWQAWMACGLLMSLPAAAQADIYRWDTGQLIPGTQGITPGPGVDLSSPMGQWSSPQRNLRFADFFSSGRLDLTDANFSSSWLDNAQFYGANLTNANFSGAVVAGASFDRVSGFGEFVGSGITLPQLYSTASYQQRNLRGIGLSRHDLTGGDFSGQDLTDANLTDANLRNANLSGAVVAGANFRYTTSRGFTKEQLYSTASYQQRELNGISLAYENNLTGWDFSGQDLTGANFSGSTLTSANLSGAVVSGADFSSLGFTKEQLYSTASYQQRNLRGILLAGDLTGWDFSRQDLTGANLGASTLTNANLAGAIVTGAGFQVTTSSGFTKEQLYSTASYQQKNLRGIALGSSNLTGWDFSGQDLTGASLGTSTLTNANLAGAIVTAAGFYEATSRGFTKEQLYSTASYQQRNLRGIGLSSNNLTGWDFSGQDLIGANFIGSTLTNANLSGTNLTGARLVDATLRNANLAGATITGADFYRSQGFTKEQLYSTANYKQRELSGISLWDVNLTGWDFSGHDLTGAYLAHSRLTNANLSGTNLTGAVLEVATLTNANLAGAIVTRASFNGTTGFTSQQLYSTASYQQRDLNGINLAHNYLSGWDFRGQDLTGASFTSSTLTNANLTGAVVTGASFWETTSRGFTQVQLASTASYQTKNLEGVVLGGNDLTGWDFSGQNLVGADFGGSTLTNANFSFADLRGAYGLSGPFQARNTIRESGAINGLDLAAGETLVVRDSEIPITVNDRMNLVSGSALELVLRDADWGSTIAMAAGVTPDLGGKLRVRFADQSNLAPLLGTTFDLFDWPAVLDTNNRFDAFELPPGTQWDLSQLYVTGTAKLTAVLLGDYNQDGTVDAADYVVWRNGLGRTYAPADYDVWRANFGRTIGGGAALPSADPLPIAIPEPSTLALLIMANVIHYARRRSAVL